MGKSFLLALFANICLSLFAFETQGDPKLWSKEDLVDFDSVGDCLSYTGDISSVFTLIEDNKLFLRVTFDDMYSHRSSIDHFKDQDIKMRLLIKSSDENLFNNLFEIDEMSKDGNIFSSLRTPEYNLFEFEIDWPYPQTRENLLFDIQIIHIFKKVMK